MEKRMDNIDLTPKQHSEVKALLKRHLPNVEIWAYGSRVTFKTRHNSDLDLVAFADKERRSALHDLREAFEESFLPFSVDLLAWSDIPERFKPNIRRAYYVLQERESGDKKFKTVKLGEVSEIIGGGTPSTNDAENYGGDIPWITPRDLSSYSQRYIKRGARNITEKGLASSSARVLPKNTVLFTTRAPIGYIALAANEVSTNQGFKGLVLKDGHVPEFYYYLLKHHTPEIVACDTGSTFGEITAGLLNSFKVKVPDTQTQKAIARILGMLDDKIEGNQRINRELEETAKMIFQLWFVDFAPVRAKVEGRPTGLSPEISALFPEKFISSELGKIPKGWKVKSLGELTSIKKGKAITKSATIKGNVPVIAGGIRPAYFHNKPNTKAPVVTISASGANAGYINLHQQDIWASDCSYISKKESETLYFWYLFLKSNQDKVYLMQEGVAQPHVYPSSLMRLRICLPEACALMKKLEEIITPFFNLSANLQKENVILQELRDALSPKLISGELQIKDAEKLIKRANV